MITGLTTAIVVTGFIGWCIYRIVHAPLDGYENEEDFYKDLKG